MSARKFDPTLKVTVGAIEIHVCSERRRRGGVGSVLGLQAWNGKLLHAHQIDPDNALERRRFARDVERREPGVTAQEVDGAILGLSSRLPPWTNATPAEGDAPMGVPYIVHNGRICTVSYDDDGRPAHQPLCNFDARIVAQVLIDDGAEPRGELEIEGTLANGRSLPVARVPFPVFPQMNWPLVRWGSSAIVSAGMGAKDRLREAIQHLSGDAPQQHVYAHTGWRLIDEGHVFLSAGGGIGKAGAVEGVQVELGGALAQIALPAPPEGDRRVKVVRASLRLWKLAPVRVMAPLLGAAYLPVLREMLGLERPDLTPWLYGGSGVLKSETIALTQAHYGPTFTRTSLATFTATANAIELMLFAAKDCLWVIDDFHPAQDQREAQQMGAVVSRLLRGVGNGSGRPRMTSDIRLRPDLPPRCVPAATGERLPDGHSTGARAFPIPVEKGDVDIGKLTRAQAERALLSEAMAAYVQWLAGRFDQLAESLPVRFRALRDKAQQDGTHLREPAQVAFLYLGLETWLTFAVEIGALGADERDRMLAEAWTSLLGLAAAQGEALAAETPARRFLALLGDGVASRRAYLEGEEGGPPEDAGAWGWELHQWTDKDDEPQTEWRHGGGAVLLGRVDDDWLYLFHEAAYQFVAARARDAGQVFPVELRTLLKRLEEAGLIAIGEDGRRTVNVRAGERTQRVLKLRRDALSPSDYREQREQRERDTDPNVATRSPGPAGAAPVPAVPAVPTNAAGEGVPAEDSTRNSGLDIIAERGVAVALVELGGLVLADAEAAGWPRLDDAVPRCRPEASAAVRASRWHGWTSERHRTVAQLHAARRGLAVYLVATATEPRG